MNFKTLRFNLMIFFLLALLQIQAGFANSLKDKLEKSQTYQYSDSRLVLSQIDSMIVSKLNAGESNLFIEKQLLPFLTKDNSLAFKQFLCEKLSFLGSEKSVQPLVSMLSEPATYDMALFALSRIPHPDVSAALREICPQLISKSKIGVIQTLGFRRDENSVELLSEYINHSNSDISSAAISALGNIGSYAALNALADATGREHRIDNSVLQHARLEAAAQLEDRNPKLSMDEYESLLSSKHISIQMGACRRLLNAEPHRFAERINQFIDQKDSVLVTAGLQWIQETESPCSVKEMKSIFSRLSPAHQTILLTSLQEMNNDMYLPVPMTALDSKNNEVRETAFNAIVELGNASTVDALVNRSWTTRSDLEAVLHTLSYLPGNQTDQAIIQAMESASSRSLSLLLTALGNRRIQGQDSLLLSYLDHTNKRIQRDAWIALGKTADESNLPQIIQAFLDLQSQTANADYIQNAIVQIIRRAPENNNCSQVILAAFEQNINKDQKIRLLELMGRIGDPDTYTLISNTLRDNDPEIVLTGIRALSNWPNSAPIFDLMNITLNAQNQKQSILALRGIDKITKTDSRYSAPVKVSIYQFILNQAPTVAEKRLALSGLSELIIPRSLKVISEYFESDVRDEAITAAVTMIPEVWWSDRQLTRDTINTLLKITDNPDHTKVLKSILIRMDQ